MTCPDCDRRARQAPRWLAPALRAEVERLRRQAGERYIPDLPPDVQPVFDDEETT